MTKLSVRSKFGQDVLWNLLSFGILGISGIVLNIIIGRFYGAGTLGVFNQVFALYIFFSQLAVFGIHLSVLKHIAEFSEDRAKCNSIITAAIIITVPIAGLTTIIGFLLSNWMGEVLQSPDVAKGWLYVLPGLLFFSLNKILMAVLNGFRHMKAFASIQAGRYVLIVGILVGCVLMKLPSFALPVIFSGAEIILLLFLFIYTLRFYSPVSVTKCSSWAWEHICFGAKGFLSGTVSQLNTRIDVLMLGYFLSDQIVGIYSMASMIVEGFIQLTVVLRNNLNPLLTKFIVQQRMTELRNVIRRGVRLSYLVMGGLGIVLIMAYPFLVSVLFHDGIFLEAWEVLIILMIGFVLYSGYLPFNMIMVQAGYPGLHTLFRTAIVISNIILNALMIPSYGINGAAYATAVSFVLSALYLKIIVKKTMNIHI